MTPDIPGADAIIARFGKWPSFHDAEIISVHINRGGTSTVSLTRTVGGRDPSIVTLSFTKIVDLKLGGEDADVQNVIHSLTIEAVPTGTRVSFGPCYGLSGAITAQTVTVSVD